MRTVEWDNGGVKMIDQRALPWSLEFARLETAEAVAESIRNMTVRGAPAIGAAAAFGMALAARNSPADSVEQLIRDLHVSAENLKAARPTAVNLAWAVDQLLAIATSGEFNRADDLRELLLRAAQKIADEDVAINSRMGLHGARLIDDGDTILHHCNTGSLATVDYGTALGVVRAAFEQGKGIHVLLDETRPRLQGSRLSAWEMDQQGISYDIIPDTAAGYYMSKGEIDIVLVGADRVAANGDFANKIGTYQLAIMAEAHDIPFYTVAPTSTIDLSLSSGAEIPIEERAPDEVTTPTAIPSSRPISRRAIPPSISPPIAISAASSPRTASPARPSTSLPRAVAGEQI